MVDRAPVQGVFGSSTEYLLAKALVEGSNPRELFLVLLPQERISEEFFSNLRFYCDFLSPKPGIPLAHFPAWEISPYESISPDFRTTAHRLRTLDSLLKGEVNALVTSVPALLGLTLPLSAFSAACVRLTPGTFLDRDQLAEQLVEIGYMRESVCEDQGFYSIRGNLIDLFAANGERPVRIEFFGDEIESIREFDPVTQRSFPQTQNEVIVIPCQEAILTSESVQRFSVEIKTLVDEAGFPKADRERLVANVRERVFFPGIEQYLPALFETLGSLLDYADASERTVVPVTVDETQLRSAGHDTYSEWLSGYELSLQRERAAYPIDRRILSEDRFESLFRHERRWTIDAISAHPDARRLRGGSFEGVAAEVKKAFPKTRIFAPVVNRIRSVLDSVQRVVVVSASQAHAERLHEYATEIQFDAYLDRPSFHPPHQRTLSPSAPVTITQGSLSTGTWLEGEPLAFLSDRDIFGVAAGKSREARFKAGDFVASFSELKAGDYIVHIDHGIGRFEGIRPLSIENESSEFLELKYADGDTLYLPVSRLNKIQRYSSPQGGAPRLDKLGGTAWAAKKARVREDILKIAHELLDNYARRKALPGVALMGTKEFAQFEESFQFEETPDQEKAIQEILDDMRKETPMDRLVCGDVGYGKTEVAMRAAYQAILSGKQVAVLAPTTILVQQHLHTFRNRFSPFPVRIESVSRFVPSKLQKEIVDQVGAGAIDILIGTHRILSREIQFKDLGLIVVDEEHRFGVEHKEALKRFRSQVDILSLTATPIPRTLQLAVSGIRDLSIIATPPENRQAIRTYVSEFDDHTIREAILRELRRGGQIFFIHNRVESIGDMATHLQRLVPEARIGIGHGQMPERKLEQVMLDFISGETNLLLSTTIVESGLDIPTANTMIIDRADMFGLSELYQLRGRVGRSNRQAFCYLLTPKNQVITEDAQKRLKVIQSYTELGAGFKIATHDLEIRGAGNILGTAQSGHIAEVGFDFYYDLLEQTISELKGDREELDIDPELNANLPAYLPERYIPDTNLRIALYKRISQLKRFDEIDQIRDELTDRFGPLPEPAILLIDQMELKVSLRALGAVGCDLSRSGMTLILHQETPVQPQKIVEKVTKYPHKYHIEQHGKLRVRFAEKPTAHADLLKRAREQLSALVTDLL